MASFSGMSQLGFDGEVPWQMVPVGGFRPVDFLDGTGFDLDIAEFGPAAAAGASTAAAFSEQNAAGPFGRPLTIQGRAAGGAVLRAKRGGGLLAHSPATFLDLQIAVLNKGVVRLKFYRVRDGADPRHESQRSEASVDKMVKDASAVYGLAANVELRRVGGIESVTLAGNQAEVFWIRPQEVSLLMSKVNPSSADLHVFLLWSLEVEDNEEHDRNVLGFTPKGTRFCAFEDDGAHAAGLDAGRNFAHEVGHHFLLDHEMKDEQNLMFWSARGKSKLTKGQILAINQRATGGTPAPAAP